MAFKDFFGCQDRRVECTLGGFAQSETRLRLLATLDFDCISSQDGQKYGTEGLISEDVCPLVRKKQAIQQNLPAGGPDASCS